MLAFTTFNVKLYPIEHVKGLKKRLGTKSSHDMDFQEDGIPFGVRSYSISADVLL
jgi:hypothetical protein